MDTVGSRRGRQSARQLSDTEAAYLAGLIDGEGSIMLSARPCRSFSPHQATPIMNITNTNLTILGHAQRLIGAGQLKECTKAAGWKTGYNLTFSSNTMRAALPQILPYLVGKKQQAEFTLEYLSLIRGTQGIAEENRERAAWLRQQVMKLNARGDEAKEELPRCVYAGCKQRAYENGPFCYHHWVQYGQKEQGHCLRCGTEMDLRHPEKQYCSRTCYMADYQRDVVEVRRTEEKAAREKIPCPVCGGAVDRSKYLRKSYCSDRCQQKAYNDSRGSRQPVVKLEAKAKPKEFLTAAGLPRLSDKGAVDVRRVVCPTCGLHYESTHPRQLFCSRACRDEARSQGRYRSPERRGVDGE